MFRIEGELARIKQAEQLREAERERLARAAVACVAEVSVLATIREAAASVRVALALAVKLREDQA